MGLRAHTSQRQGRLGQELRRMREAAKVSGAQAGAHVGIRATHISHIEAGRTHLPEPKLRALAELYGCKSDQIIEALAAMTRATGKGWWTQYKDFTDPRVRDLVELESTSTAHRAFQWMYVPGLLQTPDYMRALFTNSGPAGGVGDLDRFTEFRLRRQQVLTEGPLAEYHAVIHEAAFHMHFVDRAIMRKQLEYLVEVSQFPNVTIQLLPFRAESVPASPGGPFIVFESDVPELATIYLEHPVASQFLGDPGSISRFSSDHQRLSNAALAPLQPDALYNNSSYRLVQHLLYIL